MFGLAKMYEKRLNNNMQRHRLDVKIAPSRPQPSCRPVFYEHLTCEAAEPKIAEKALKVAAAEPIVIVEPSSPAMFVKEKPVVEEPAGFFKPLARHDSAESGFFTGHESDAASNVSFSA